MSKNHFEKKLIRLTLKYTANHHFYDIFFSTLKEDSLYYILLYKQIR